LQKCPLKHKEEKEINKQNIEQWTKNGLKNRETQD
jgi:hypothetical protein